MNLKFYYVDNYEYVENPIPFMDETTMTFSFYYDVSRNDIYIYNDNVWGSYSALSEGVVNGGAIIDKSEATTEGCYYALLDIGWKPLGAAEYDGEVVIE